jgi:hypothetical protein
MGDGIMFVLPPACALCARVIVGASTLVVERAARVTPEGQKYTMTYTTHWCPSCADILPPPPYDPSEPDYAE